MLDNLVADYLRHKQYLKTHSLFYAEAGIAERELNRAEIAEMFQAEQGGGSVLQELLKDRTIFGPRRAETFTQTSVEQTSLEHKL